MLEGLLGVGLKALFSAFFQNLFGWLQQQQSDRDHEALGRAQVEAAQNKEAADAERRSAAAAANTPDVGGVLDDMERGKF